ncbi:hypothetical protein HYV74_04870 [Candidatus Uhrbacteria bacterium]|nr:hypothetical protein [Candidatus Uhrbacteria bacterium]
MKSFFVALIVGMIASRIVSSVGRYKTATRTNDAAATVKQIDRLAGAIGFLAFLGVLAGGALSKKSQDRLNGALAQIPRR